TDELVVVAIRVPHVRVSNAESHVQGREFTFYCKPYLLKLIFPHDLVEDDVRCRAVYDPSMDDGTVTVHLPKAEAGQYFEDLDLTTKLLQPRWTPSDLPWYVGAVRGEGGEEGVSLSGDGPGIEVIASEVFPEGQRDDEEGVEAGAGAGAGARGGGGEGKGKRAGGSCPGAAERGLGKKETAAEVEKGVMADVEPVLAPPTYGFNNRFSDFFGPLQDQLRDVVQLPNPDRMMPASRKPLRLADEDRRFRPDRYLGDLYQGCGEGEGEGEEEKDPILVDALAFRPHWGSPDDDDGDSSAAGPGTKGRGGGGEGGEEEGGGGFSGFSEEEEEQLSASAHASQCPRAVSPNPSSFDFCAEPKTVFCLSPSCRRRLPNREHLVPLGSREEEEVLLGLGDVLFGYAYDHRTTGGEPSVESAWTVAVLSPLLSWLE
ncbi:unnamed protein product, partial [Discosporangium mesarthrocarpum]